MSRKGTRGNIPALLLTDCPFDHPGGVADLAHVALYENRFASGGAHFGCHFLGGLEVVQKVDPHVCSGLRKRNRDCPSNTLLGTGYQCHLSAEFHHVIVPKLVE